MIRSSLARVRPDGVLLACCGILVALGVFLRAWDLGYPDVMTFDEHHFVENARNYITRTRDWNDHPPLGKLLMVPAMLALGDNATGWRAAQLVLGLWSVVSAGLLAGTLFHDRRAAWLARAFVAGDGFLIAYSRTALLDGMLAALVLTTVLLAVRARSPLGFAAVGVAIGCAASIKVVGCVLGLPAAALCLCQQRRFSSLAMLGLAPIAFMLIEMAGLALAREPCSPADAWAATFRRVESQLGANYFLHPLTSRWYTWLLPTRPITLRYEVVGGGAVRGLTTLGNPLLWWSATLALIGCILAAARLVVRRAAAGPARVPIGRVMQASLILLSFAAVLLLPWMSGVRDSYIYHYLPTYTLFLVLVGGLTSRVYRSRRRVAQAFTAAVALVSLMYAPVWGQLPISPRAFETRLYPWVEHTEPPRIRVLDVERCERGVDHAALEASQEGALGIYYRECSDVYAERSCREVFQEAARLPLSARLPAIATTCASAYCPSLPAGLDLCAADVQGGPEDIARAWPPLNTAIVEHDARHLAPRVTAALFRFYAVLQKLPPAPPVPAQ